MAQPFCSLRVEKLKQTALSSAGTHNMRLEGCEQDNIDSKKTHLNQTLIPNPNGLTLEQLVENRLSEMDVRSVKKNATKALEMVITTTPTYFRDDPDNWGVYDQEKMEAWRDATMTWLKDKYGDNLIQVELHLDEKTPHLHAIVVPIAEKELKHRRTKAEIAADAPARTYVANRLDGDMFTKKDKLTELQDEYAEAVKDLGIQRGLKGSKAKHQDLKKYGAKLMDQTGDEIHPNALKTATIPPPKKGMGIKKYVAFLQNKVTDFYEKRINYLVKMVEQLKTRNNDLAMQLKIEKDRTAMYASEIHSPEEIDHIVQRAAERTRDAENRSQELVGALGDKDDKIQELEAALEHRDRIIDNLREPEKPQRTMTPAQAMELNG